MVSIHTFNNADELYILYGLFEHIPDTDITIIASYSVDLYATQELYVNVPWIDLRQILAITFPVIDDVMTIVVSAGAMAVLFVPDEE